MEYVHDNKVKLRKRKKSGGVEFLANGPFNLSGFEWTVGQELTYFYTLFHLHNTPHKRNYNPVILQLPAFRRHPASRPAHPCAKQQ